MDAYWLGVLTPLGVLVGLSAALWLLRAALNVATYIVTKVGPDTAETKRAALAATCYSSRKAWLLGTGDLGVAVFVGIDGEKRAEAYRRVHSPRRIRLADLGSED